MIRLRSARSLADWIAHLGGTLNGLSASDAVCSILSIGAHDEDISVDLVPILHERGLALWKKEQRTSVPKVLLLQQSLASEVTFPLVWVHPHADWVLAMLLTLKVSARSPLVRLCTLRPTCMRP